jgi:hypothetical protein
MNHSPGFIMIVIMTMSTFAGKIYFMRLKAIRVRYSMTTPLPPLAYPYRLTFILPRTTPSEHGVGEAEQGERGRVREHT